MLEALSLIDSHLMLQLLSSVVALPVVIHVKQRHKSPQKFHSFQNTVILKSSFPQWKWNLHPSQWRSEVFCEIPQQHTPHCLQLGSLHIKSIQLQNSLLRLMPATDKHTHTPRRTALTFSRATPLDHTHARHCEFCILTAPFLYWRTDIIRLVASSLTWNDGGPSGFIWMEGLIRWRLVKLFICKWKGEGRWKRIILQGFLIKTFRAGLLKKPARHVCVHPSTSKVLFTLHRRAKPVVKLGLWHHLSRMSAPSLLTSFCILYCIPPEGLLPLHSTPCTKGTHSFRSGCPTDVGGVTNAINPPPL